MPSVDVTPDPPNDESPQKEVEKLPGSPKTLTGCLNNGPANGHDTIMEQPTPIDAPPVDTTYHKMTELKQTDESAEETTLSYPPNRPISFEDEDARSSIPPEHCDCSEIPNHSDTETARSLRDDPQKSA